MAVKAGPAPYNTGYTDWAKYNTKRVTKRTLRTQNIDWTLSSGYRNKTMSELWGKPREYKTKSIKLYNGRTVQVTDADFEDFMGFMGPMVTEEAATAEIAKQIETTSWTQHVDGVGHIIAIDYSPMRQLMKVEFAKGGGIVVHFSVPKEVYSELRIYAESGATSTDSKGKVRHVLGMRYWDMVRIRQTQHGVRYKFKYVRENASTATGARLSDEAYLAQHMSEKERAEAASLTKAELDKEAADTVINFIRRSKTAQNRFGDRLPVILRQLSNMPYAEVKKFALLAGVRERDLPEY